MSSFHVQLINDPFADPGVYLEFTYRKEAILFDLGEISTLTPRQILKVSHAFISHTHMDHFIGFDYLVRLSLGRDHRIHLFGPPGFIANVDHRLHAYTWNLVGEYNHDFLVEVTELTTHFYPRHNPFFLSSRICPGVLYGRNALQGDR